MVRKAADLKEFGQIQGITGDDLRIIELSFKNPSLMVYALRTSPDLLGEKTNNAVIFRKVYKYLFENGFIRDDLNLSFAYGKFMNELHGVTSLYYDSVSDFKSNRDYERFEPINIHKVQMFESVIRDVGKLNNFQAALVIRRYGLNGETPMSMGDLSRWSGKGVDSIEETIRRSMVRLQKPEMKRFFRAVYSYDMRMG